MVVPHSTNPAFVPQISSRSRNGILTSNCLGSKQDFYFQVNIYQPPKKMRGRPHHVPKLHFGCTKDPKDLNVPSCRSAPFCGPDCLLWRPPMPPMPPIPPMPPTPPMPPNLKWLADEKSSFQNGAQFRICLNKPILQTPKTHPTFVDVDT